ncbi:MAG: hypothetical protein HRU14_15095 [Planctomycetes bacterium]|nr:hypothetical protein [Planctomycetota bacterium]
MRGSSLSDRSVAKSLEPFIVCVWNGANRREMPPEVRDVWDTADLGRMVKNNIVLFVLDRSGKFVDWFQPFPGKNPSSLGFSQRRQAEYIRSQVERVKKRLPMPRQVEAKTELTLPELEKGKKGVRVMLSLDCPRMSSYKAPVVEVVETTTKEAKALAYSVEPRTIDAASLGRWLKQIYPPAIMVRSGQVTSVSGALRLTAAGKKGKRRYATLTGDVRMTMDDGQGTTFTGTLEAVVTYAAGSDAMEGFRGVYVGMYPKPDRHRRRPQEIGLRAVIESLPK